MFRIGVGKKNELSDESLLSRAIYSLIKAEISEVSDVKIQLEISDLM